MDGLQLQTRLAGTLALPKAYEDHKEPERTGERSTGGRASPRAISEECPIASEPAQTCLRRVPLSKPDNHCSPQCLHTSTHSLAGATRSPRGFETGLGRSARLAGGPLYSHARSPVSALRAPGNDRFPSIVG